MDVLVAIAVGADLLIVKSEPTLVVALPQLALGEQEVPGVGGTEPPEESTDA